MRMRLQDFKLGRYDGRTLLTILVLSLFIFDCFRWVNAILTNPEYIELVASSYPGQITIRDQDSVLKIYREIREAGDDSKGSGKKDAPSRSGKNNSGISGHYRLNFRNSRGSQTYIFDQPGLLLDPASGRLLRLGDGGECLQPFLQELEAKYRFGQMLPWDQVNKIFPRFAKARVRDLETGLAFQVQRRAGSRHADVQPLTAEDTRIMKQIYGGRWSWERRAIIVEINGYRLAASMNGMPHGAGAIEGNNFDGHFCIHFLNSRLHTGSGNQDPGHQLMVWKAAGRVAEMLAGVGPDRMALTMLTALAQRDLPLALDMIQTSSEAGSRELTAALQKVKWFAVTEVKVMSGAGSGAKAGSNSGRVTVEAVISFQLEGQARVDGTRVLLELVKDSGKYPWKVTAGSVVEMLGKS